MMRTFIFFLCTTVFGLTTENSLAQEKIKIDADKIVSVDEVFDIIKEKTKYRFLYPNGLFKNAPSVELKKGTVGINKLLIKAIPKRSFNVILGINNIIIVKEKTKSQNKEVSGKVLDSEGNSLPGVTVLIKGTTKGTITDFDGNYSITVPNSENVLVFSFLGFKTQEVVVSNQSIINITLEPSNSELDEVVLIGYGKVKKEDLTGSVGTVDVKGIKNQAPTINIDNALQGQVAGVNVTSNSGQPGAAARVRIRGNTSLLGSNQPLYVIDGIPVVSETNIPFSPTGNLGLGTDEGLSTPLGNINAQDIGSISILKDASAAAIYGSRAANGVIIINTKQGNYYGETKFTANVSTSIQSAQTLDVLNAQQYKDVWTTAVENGTADNAFTQSILDGSYFGDADTNWEDEISPSAPISTNYYLNVLGGSDKTKYSTSLGINTQDGVYENSGFDRYSFIVNLDSKLNDNWTFGTKLNVSFTDQDAIDSGITQLIYSFRPDLPVFDDEANFTFSPQYNLQNPVALSKATNNNKTFLVLGSLYTQVRLAKGLNFKTLFSLNYNTGNRKSFYPDFTNGGGFSRTRGIGDGFAEESRSLSTNTLLQNTLTYEVSINKHNINSVLGASFENNKSSFVKGWGEGFFNDVLTNITNATTSTDASSFETGSGLASYFGRINYDFDDKYLATLSARVDGSSKFGEDNRYAFFPAAAFAWKISNEKFLNNTAFIDELKLRASIGTTGQQDFENFAGRTLFETGNYANDPSIIATQLGNSELKWETTDQLDLGLDFSLFNGRLSGGLGYYSKKTKDALFIAIPPGSTGFSSIVANVGDTKNVGVELELNSDIISTDNFRWNLSFNISKNENSLTRISDGFKGEDGFLTGFPGGGRLIEGSPIGLIYGYVAEGIFQNQNDIDALNTGSSTGVYQNAQTSPGDLKFKDISGPDGVPDGIITDLDQQVIGDTQPDFFGGINNTFQYKGFTLSTFFNFSVGNDLYASSLGRDLSFASTFFGENKESTVLNAWTPENTGTNIPRSVYLDPNDNDRLSTHYVYDASYIRLKTLNFSYEFSQRILEQIKFLDAMSISITAQNLFTITNYPGANPEASNLFNNDIAAGQDLNRFPLAKVYTMGIKVGF